MKTLRYGSFILLATGLLGCEVQGPLVPNVNAGQSSPPLRNAVADVWIDPDGCQHWYIDDGFEGYMTPRLNPDGTPRCI